MGGTLTLMGGTLTDLLIMNLPEEKGVIEFSLLQPAQARGLHGRDLWRP